MSALNNKYPNFIIAGCAKSGTTALHYMLDQHPDIFMSVVKETNYFIYGYEKFHHYVEHTNTKSLNGVLASDICDSKEKYQALFAAASDKQILGEASPWYLLNSFVPSRIVEFNPNAKIILVLRNPTDVVFANFVHQVRDAVESLQLENIEEIFEEKHYANEKLHPFSKHLEIPKYASHMPRYLNVFSKDSILVLIYEEFLNNKQASLDKVFDFLSVNKSKSIEVDKKVNISGLPKNKKLKNVLQSNNFLKRFAAKAIPQKQRAKLRAKIEALNTQPKPKLDNNIRRKLDNLYVEDRQFVEEYLQRKIEVWPRND